MKAIEQLKKILLFISLYTLILEGQNNERKKYWKLQKKGMTINNRVDVKIIDLYLC